MNIRLTAIIENGKVLFHVQNEVENLALETEGMTFTIRTF